MAAARASRRPSTSGSSSGGELRRLRGVFGGVHDYDAAARQMRDPIRHVRQEELLAPAHPDVADDEQVGELLVGPLDDALRRIGVDLDPSAAELTGGRACLAGRRSLGVGVGLRHDPQEDELGFAAAGLSRRPLDSAGGGWRAVGGDNDALDVSPANGGRWHNWRLSRDHAGGDECRWAEPRCCFAGSRLTWRT